jgi:LacI family transcriptional regulator
MNSSGRKTVSQASIAKKTGLARTTVSIALGGGGALAKKTVERVLRAAQELGYQPNRLVRAMRSGRTGMVGVMIPPRETFWSEITCGIHDVLVARSYVPLGLWIPRASNEESEQAGVEAIQRLLQWRVDGVILYPWFAMTYEKHLAEFSRRNLPLVTIDCDLPSVPGLDVVRSDEKKAGQLVAEHLYLLGHRRVLYFSGPSNEGWWSRERLESFTGQWLARPDATAEVVAVPSSGDFDPIIAEGIRSHSGCSAIYAATNKIGQSVLRVCRNLGIKIPEKISLVVFAGSNGVPGAPGSGFLTTIQQAPYEIGKTAADFLLHRISKKWDRYPKQEARIPVQIIDGESTAPKIN